MYTRILVPWILWDKIIQSSWGVSTMVPPIIFSWSLEDSIEDVKSLDRSVYIYIYTSTLLYPCVSQNGSKWISIQQLASFFFAVLKMSPDGLIGFFLTMIWFWTFDIFWPRMLEAFLNRDDCSKNAHHPRDRCCAVLCTDIAEYHSIASKAGGGCNWWMHVD